MQAPSAKIILGCLVLGLITFAVLSYFEKQRLETKAEYNSLTITLINNKASVSSIVVFIFLALNSYFSGMKKQPPSQMHETITTPPQPINETGVPPSQEHTAASL